MRVLYCSRPRARVICFRILHIHYDYSHILQIDALTKVFRLSDDVYKRMKTLLNADMDRGLQRTTHHTATVKMFHTHVRTLPNGSGMYIK